MSHLWLVVGLGNPGPRYEFTRHNVGFLSLDFFARSLLNSPSENQIGDSGPLAWKEEHGALCCRLRLGSSSLLLAKPITFMNLSGRSVQELMQFYKISMDYLLVVHDDIDQAFGKMKFHKNRGHGGHNGVRSISESLGSSNYVRLKLGIGRPANPEESVAAFVLNTFTREEEKTLADFLNTAGDGIETFILRGLNDASTKFNG